MRSIIELVNEGDYERLSVSQVHAARYAALMQSGFDPNKTDCLRKLVNCSVGELNRVAALYNLFFDGFGPGDAVKIHGVITCGGCNAQVYSLPCVRCGDATWVKNVASYEIVYNNPSDPPPADQPAEALPAPKPGRRLR